MPPAQGCTADRHGTRTAYMHHGCRCPQARRAVRRYSKHARAGYRSPEVAHTVDATGVHRRIRALQAIGWPGARLAALLGHAGQSNPPVMKQATVYPATAAKVDQLYQRLRRIPGPSAEAMRRARQRGSVPPDGWPGDSIDDPEARPWGADAPLHPDAAVCRRHDNPDLWHYEGVNAVREAVAGCRRCPLRRPCLSYALVHDERYGTWGGLSQERRNRVRDQLGAGAVEGSPELEAVLDATTGTRC